MALVRFKPDGTVDTSLTIDFHGTSDFGNALAIDAARPNRRRRHQRRPIRADARLALNTPQRVNTHRTPNPDIDPRAQPGHRGRRGAPPDTGRRASRDHPLLRTPRPGLVRARPRPGGARSPRDRTRAAGPALDEQQAAMTNGARAATAAPGRPVRTQPHPRQVVLARREPTSPVNEPLVTPLQSQSAVPTRSTAADHTLSVGSRSVTNREATSAPAAGILSLFAAETHAVAKVAHPRST